MTKLNNLDNFYFFVYLSLHWYINQIFSSILLCKEFMMEESKSIVQLIKKEGMILVPIQQYISLFTTTVQTTQFGEQTQQRFRAQVEKSNTHKFKKIENIKTGQVCQKSCKVRKFRNFRNWDCEECFH